MISESAEMSRMRSIHLHHLNLEILLAEIKVSNIPSAREEDSEVVILPPLDGELHLLIVTLIHPTLVVYPNP